MCGVDRTAPTAACHQPGHSSEPARLHRSLYHRTTSSPASSRLVTNPETLCHAPPAILIAGKGSSSNCASSPGRGCSLSGSLMAIGTWALVYQTKFNSAMSVERRYKTPVLFGNPVNSGVNDANPHLPALGTEATRGVRPQPHLGILQPYTRSCSPPVRCRPENGLAHRPSEPCTPTFPISTLQGVSSVPSLRWTEHSGYRGYCRAATLVLEMVGDTNPRATRFDRRVRLDGR